MKTEKIHFQLLSIENRDQIWYLIKDTKEDAVWKYWESQVR
jgi:hypothetical protein